MLFNTNWNDLSIEGKIFIVQKLGNSCRLSLRACSRSDNQLVDSVPFRTIHRIVIDCSYLTHSLCIMKKAYDSKTKFEFELFSYDFLQNRLLEELKNVDHIRTLEVRNDSYDFNLSANGKLVRVGRMVIRDPRTKTPKIIERVEPYHLRRLEIDGYDISARVFDLPQVQQADVILCGSNYIEVRQMLKMNASFLELGESYKLREKQIFNYIQKCLCNMDEKQATFLIANKQGSTNIQHVFKNFDADKSRFGYIDGVFKTVLNSVTPVFQLQFEERDGLNVRGYAVYKNDAERKAHKVGFKSVKSVCVTDNSYVIREKIGYFVSKRSKYIEVYPLHKFQTTNCMAEKLSEALEEIDYIKHLQLKRFNNIEQILSGKEHITVGSLLLGNCDAVKCLPSFEPVHLKEIEMISCSHRSSLYDLPQIVLAKKLKTKKRCSIRDDQLPNLNAISLDLEVFNITEKGVIELMKKWMLNLDSNDYNFTFKPDDRSFFSFSRLSKAFYVFYSKTHTNGDWEFIFNSPHSSAYKFHLFFHDKTTTLKGNRVVRKENTIKS